jgi:putative membrane protein
MIAHGFWGGPGWGILQGLFFVAFWVFVIILLVGMVRGRGGGASSSSALRVLEERYARGEMNRDEFVERRRILTGQAGPTEPAPPTKEEG